MLGKLTISNNDSKETQKREIKLFTIVMIVFTIGMAFLIFYEISAWWIWYLYFIIWTLIEVKIAKNLKLNFWYWTLIIIAIITVDWLVLELVELIKS